jgi:transcriptional regulator with XRE-family HTH domain
MAPMTEPAFAELLRSLLDARGFTFASLGRKLGIRRSSISKWFTGVGNERRLQVPSTAHLNAVILALELDGPERRSLEQAYLASGRNNP